MKTTHLQAKQELIYGNVDKAWKIAQKDEGLLPDVTKEYWLNAMLNQVFPTLTDDNAKQASTVICKTNPEWGAKRFNYDPAYGHHTQGTGSNSALLFSGEFKFWSVVSFKGE